MRTSSVLESSVFNKLGNSYWLPNHPTLVYATAKVVPTNETESDAVQKLKLKADLDGFEVEVDAPGNTVHASALNYLPDLMNLGEFSEACLLHTIRSRYTDINKLYT